METIILITVLSTLGAVALVASILVVFNKLKNKLDYLEYQRDIAELFTNIQNIENDIHSRINKVESLVDSRCDKLHTEIKNSKQIIKG
jgi:peptidoglycan hydrolase CwlO-like protein